MQELLNGPPKKSNSLAAHMRLLRSGSPARGAILRIAPAISRVALCAAPRYGARRASQARLGEHKARRQACKAQPQGLSAAHQGQVSLRINSFQPNFSGNQEGFGAQHFSRPTHQYGCKSGNNSAISTLVAEFSSKQSTNTQSSLQCTSSFDNHLQQANIATIFRHQGYNRLNFQNINCKSHLPFICPLLTKGTTISAFQLLNRSISPIYRPNKAHFKLLGHLQRILRSFAHQVHISWISAYNAHLGPYQANNKQ